MEFRNDIQGLRAIAVLSVFIFHLNPSWLPGGFIGVDIFFVISGFLISSICFNQLAKNQFSFISFYKSRIKRIVPAYFVLLFVVAIISYYLFFETDYYNLKQSYFWSILFQSNDFFYTLDTYFGVRSSENPFLHTWTLAVEMQFYLFLPFILFFIKRKWLFVAIPIIIILLFSFGTIEIMKNNKSEVYYSLLARTPEFLIGVLASLLNKKWNSIKNVQKRSFMISIVSLVVLFSCFVLINEDSFFPGFLASIPCLATAFLLISPVNGIRTILSNKTLFFLGNLSYSLYLWHWPIMAFVRYFYQVSAFSSIQLILVILLSFILSLASYYLIENPLKKLKSYLFWILLLFLFCINIISYKFISDKSKMANRIPEKYTRPYFRFHEVTALGDSLGTGAKVFLVGDSHAYSMSYYFDLLGKKYNLPIRVISNAKYPPIAGLDRSVFDNDLDFVRYQNLSKSSEIEIESSDIIILSIYMSGESFKSITAKNLINKIKPDQSLIVLSDYPRIDKNPVRRNKDYIKDSTKTNKYEVSYPVDQSIIDALQSHPNCYYLDLSKEKTFADIPFYNDTLMYYDEGHINGYGEKVYFENTGQEVMNLIDSIYRKK